MQNGQITRALKPYEYEYLKDPLNVRIVVLIPAEDPSAAIECELEEWPMEKWDKGESRYEALSWCWNAGEDTRPGVPPAKRALRIHTANGVRVFDIFKHLYEGLQALRDTERKRYLWIDALCIWQDKARERNQQVPRMKDIYGRASNVCIWLGKPINDKEEKETQTAFNFVESELLDLWNFDSLCDSSECGPKWAALLKLMKRPWFSRRWIVQEISLAQQGTVHRGSWTMPWQAFADAVSLFVQVEETLAKLSVAMRNTSHHSPHDFFAEVPFLGATLLVQTTNDIFQRSATGGHYKQRSLESLVSRLAIFQSSEPRDTVYGLLAMAKDSDPYASQHEELQGLTRKTRELLFKISKHLVRPSKAWYVVSYKSQVIDVYQEFIAFTIRNADPLRALDIICRPFAPEYKLEQDFSFDEERLKDFTPEQRGQIVGLPSWVPNIKDLPFAMCDHLSHDGVGSGNLFNRRMTRVNGDSFVGTPEQRLYSASGLKKFNKDKLRFRKWKAGSNGQGPYSMFVEGFILDDVGVTTEPAHLGNIPPSWLKLLGWTDTSVDPPDSKKWDRFWRTLVGNRDPKGSDPPVYYQRACKEIFRKNFGGSLSNQISRPNVSAPIASFMRRVHSVVYGRRLIETRNGRFGLVSESVESSNVICIFYGCSVPVILKKVPKNESEIKREEQEDEEADREFEKRAAEKLKRVFASRKIARQVIPPALKGVPRIKTMLHIWKRYRLLHLVRITVILALAFWISREGEPLTVALLVLIASCYLLSYTNHGFNEPALTWWTPIEAIVTIICIAPASTLLKPYGPKLPEQARMVSTGFISIFPQLLHLPARKVYIRARDRVEKRLVEIDNSVTESLQDLANIHWRIFSALKGFIQRYRRQMPRRKRERPEQYYRLVGECYIHEMMDGEAIKYQTLKQIKTQVFEIR